MIRMQSVTTTARRGRTALTDITLDLHPGSATAVVGEGGTSLLGLVNRLVEPTSGRIEWDDKPLRQYRKATLRRAVGWWSRPEGLFAELSVFDNIAVVPHRLGWQEQVQRSRVFELLELLGVPRTVATLSPPELPRVQRALVALARALAASPEVVLGDDPLAGFSPDEAAQLAEIARRVQPDWGDIWLVATGSVDVGIVLADRLVVLDEGRIAQQGTVADVIEVPLSPRVADLIGPHRGARALALRPAAELQPQRVATVRDPRSARAGEPTLVVDANAQPVAWTRGIVAADGEVATDPLGVSFVPKTDTLRDALEAVLTSPTGLGVAVGEHGRYLGVIDADAIRTVDLRYRAEVSQARADQAFALRKAARSATPDEQPAVAEDADAPDESQQAAET